MVLAAGLVSGACYEPSEAYKRAECIEGSDDPDKQCPSGYVCINSDNHTCHALCTPNERQCGAAEGCVEGICQAFALECETHEQCTEGADNLWYCNDVDHICRKYPSVVSCDNHVKDGDESDTDCGGERCEPCSNGKRCAQDADCDAGNTCDEGVCNRCGDGTVRADPGEEQTEECDDGNTILEECVYPSQSCTVCGPTCQEEDGIPNICGDGNIDSGDGETCDDGAHNGVWSADGLYCSATCNGRGPFCGDGVVDGSEAGVGETCDDGANNSDDWQALPHCRTDCSKLAPFCGDGVLHGSDAGGEESCDDGAGNSNDWKVAAHCKTDCSGLAPHCGDGVVDGSDAGGEESCDDGAGNSDDWKALPHCKTDCSGFAPYCGDGVVDGSDAGGDETCDDGVDNSDDWQALPHCKTDCSKLAPFCGDGVLHGSDGGGEESCDDGAGNSNDWNVAAHCKTDCSGFAPYCGDGVLHGSDAGGAEACDDGADNSDDWKVAAHCKTDCSGLAPHCGDGVVDGSDAGGEESCDDGADNSDDWRVAARCKTDCTGFAPYCGDGVVDGSDAGGDETCDDGATNSDDWQALPHCKTDCSKLAPFCGDGVLQGSDAGGDETCDDGTTNSDDWQALPHCKADCSGLAPYCGDGVLHGSDEGGEETCDDGADSSDDWQVAAHCKTDCSGLAPHCGDEVVQGSYEECGEPGLSDCDSGKECSGCRCDDAPPEAPVLALGEPALKRLVFSWETVLSASTYNLYEDPDGSGNYTLIAEDLTATSYEHTIPVHLRAAAQYRLEACNLVGCTLSEPLLVGSKLAQAIGYFKASNTGAYGYFGYSVALSNDGNTLAVGAYGENSSATGIDGDEGDESAKYSGAVYVFTRSGSTWAQQAYVKASNTGRGDAFGIAVALSSDGNTLAVGAYGEDSNAKGVGGYQDNDSAPGSGAVYVFARSESAWEQQAYVKASNTGSHDSFGYSVALSSDGNTLAVGARWEDSSATGIDGDQQGGSDDSGAAYVFGRSGSAWSQQAYVKASNTGAGDWFGESVALSGDGNTLVVAAQYEESSARGINGDQGDGSDDTGAVYVFARSESGWTQQAYVKASNTDPDDRFGAAVALSNDGNTLAVGAANESSNATGTDTDNDQSDNSASASGAVYLFSRSESTWAQQAYVKASNTGGGDWFGVPVALSSDGNTLAVGAAHESSNATGIEGDEEDNSASVSGAAYVFARSGSTWAQQAYVKASNTRAYNWFGIAVALSSDGSTLAVGAYQEGSSATGIGGAQDDNLTHQSGAAYLY
jgi:hypothetical protein